MWPCIVTNFFLIKLTDALICQIYFGMKLYMFRAVPLPIIRSLFTVHSALVYVIQVSSRIMSCSKPVWHKPVPNVQWINSWWWAEELPETCRVSCQNKFEKLVRLVGFIKEKKILSTVSHLICYNYQNIFERSWVTLSVLIPSWCIQAYLIFLQTNALKCSGYYI